LEQSPRPQILGDFKISNLLPRRSVAAGLLLRLGTAHGDFAADILECHRICRIRTFKPERRPRSKPYLMKNELRPADHPQRGRLGTADVHDQTHDQVRQIEAAVESIGERAKGVVGVLAVSE